MTPLALCAVLGAGAWPAPDPVPLTPADAVRAAAADARAMERGDPARAFQTRYLAAQHLSPAERLDLFAVDSLHVNLISREATIAKPRRVNAWLWAVDVRDYGWRRETFGALTFGTGAREPYFHVQVIDVKGGRTPAGAPWLPAADLADLIRITGSQTPIVRADWFLHRTAIQEGRGESGYYDFLSLGSRKDAEKLAGLDRKSAEEIYREQAAVIHESGVALQGRQLFRYSTIAGSWWESRDTKAEESGRDDRNPVRRLLADYKHDAEEIVFTLPNRLPAFYLSDAAGKGIGSAPPDIASDSKSPTNDKRVHVGLSCIRCHTRGGLIGFDDLFRRVYSGDRLRAADDKLERRLRSVYLGPIQRAFTRDTEDYAEAIGDACGLTPAGLAAAYSRQWSRYADEPVDVVRAAAETGFAEGEFLKRIRAYATAQRINDPVLLMFVGPEPRAMRREQFEELFPLLMTALEKKP